jgi:UDP-N-acetylmuramoylalanine--D-glutamate ligase
MSDPATHPSTALILGLGTSGLAMARWCARAGLAVVVADTRDDPPGLGELRQALPNARFRAGAFEPALLSETGAGLVLKSPGITPGLVAPLLAAARAAAIPVNAELDLFAGALARLRHEQAYQPKLIAITGTNGKTTVTALTAQLVARAGKSVAAAGNIGPSLLDTLAGHLDSGTLPEVWVLELSSFQLADALSTSSDGFTAGFEPDVATVLNVSQDHLDWHGSLDAYAQAKARIFGRQASMLLNRDDPIVMAMHQPSSKPRDRRKVIQFGDGLPTRAGDFGIEQAQGVGWLVRALEADPTVRTRKDAEADPLHIQRLMPAQALRIRGRHNALNALAALALACAAGCALAPMLYGLREYRGEPHRVEAVGVVAEVEYFDDSKGTNVGATVAALLGLGSERRLVVILGGDGKGQDFSPLATPVARHARAVVLIGRDRDRIRAVLAQTGVPLLDATTMDEAVRCASEQARGGDAVLLSPACASLDMFRNYAHRAEVFRQAVSELALERGTSLEAIL